MAGCLKCGKNRQEGAEFCEECLAVMNRSPVKPGTIARIPDRPPRKEYTPKVAFQEEVIKSRLTSMSQTIRWLSVLTVILSILLLLMVGVLLTDKDEKPDAPPIGKNYTTTTTSTPHP